MPRFDGSKEKIGPLTLSKIEQILEALSVVDFVFIFEEDTPLELIKALRPNVLVKGATTLISGWSGNRSRELGRRGKALCLVEGYSTTEKLAKLSKRNAIETAEHPQ